MVNLRTSLNEIGIICVFDPDHKIANVFCLFIVYVGALLKGAPFFIFTNLLH
jgi:hypothetical protein